MTNERFHSGQIQLLNFFNDKVLNFINLKKDFSILDIGYGDRSIFEQWNFEIQPNVLAIDPNGLKRDHEFIDYKQISLFDLKDQSFDLIFDSHTLHTLNSINEFKEAILNISKLLSTGGLFAIELNIFKENSTFDGRLKLNYLDVEKWIIESGLEIKLFLFLNNAVFYQGMMEGEILQIIARKK